MAPKEIDLTPAAGAPRAVPDKPEVQLVVFLLAGCELAVDIRKVREIIRVPEITLMPKAPPFLEGIINLRGRIIAVLDLKKSFDIPRIDRTEESRVLVVEINGQMMGLLVDKVVGVQKVQPALIQPATEAVLNIGAEFIEGLVALADRMILLFRLENIPAIAGGKLSPELETNPAGDGKNSGD